MTPERMEELRNIGMSWATSPTAEESLKEFAQDLVCVDEVHPEQPKPRTYEERQAARLDAYHKRQQFMHMTTHGMSGMPRYVRLRAVRGGCFVDVYYAYAFIQMPFNSIRLAKRYVKQLGLPIERGDAK